ncbi:hypothetical protein ACJX0J_027596, partial [Zea mays]
SFFLRFYAEEKELQIDLHFLSLFLMMLVSCFSTVVWTVNPIFLKDAPPAAEEGAMEHVIISFGALLQRAIMNFVDLMEWDRSLFIKQVGHTKKVEITLFLYMKKEL